MHLKKDFITQDIGDKQMIVAVGEAASKFCGIVECNHTAAFVVDKLKDDTTEDAIVSAFLKEYEVSEEVARRDVKKVIESLKTVGAIEG